jgi:hypothetical protein
VTASPTALDLARACVYVEEAGPWNHIRIVPPGQEPHQAIHWTSAKAEDLPHQRDAVVAMLAPFIDLGMARGRLSPDLHPLWLDPPPLEPWRRDVEPPRTIAPEVAHDCVDDDDGDPG